MKNVVLKYGLLAGGIQVVIGFGLMALLIGDGSTNVGYAELLGYATMIVSLSLIFFGIKTYRDEQQGGIISFGQAAKVGVLITLVASALYVLGWLLYYHLGSGEDMMNAYLTEQIADMRNSGQSAQTIEEEIDKMNGFMEMYQQPLIMIGITFMEIFPVGLIISLIAAVLLRTKAGAVDSRLA